CDGTNCSARVWLRQCTTSIGLDVLLYLVTCVGVVFTCRFHKVRWVWYVQAPACRCHTIDNLSSLRAKVMPEAKHSFNFTGKWHITERSRQCWIRCHVRDDRRGCCICALSQQVSLHTC